MKFKVLSITAMALLMALCGCQSENKTMEKKETTVIDAIMSRRPLEDRQRILKDSHTGAFAVVSVVFLILAYYSCVTTAVSYGFDPVNLAIIPVVSRSVSGLEVLISRPMGTSQYVEMTQENKSEDGKATKKEGFILLTVQLAVYLAATFILCRSLTVTAMICGSVAAAGFIAVTFGKKQLGGMNGDIAGYGIVWGELAGLCVLALC